MTAQDHVESLLSGAVGARVTLRIVDGTIKATSPTFVPGMAMPGTNDDGGAGTDAGGIAEPRKGPQS